MDSQMRQECRSLLQQLKTSQQKLRRDLISQDVLEGKGKEGHRNLVDSENSCLKPAYATSKLLSLVKDHPTLKTDNACKTKLTEDKENVFKYSGLSNVADQTDKFHRTSDISAHKHGTDAEYGADKAVENGLDTFSHAPVTADITMPSMPATSSIQYKRQLIDRHTTVPTRLDAEELQELNNVRKLNFSYSHVNPQVWSSGNQQDGDGGGRSVSKIRRQELASSGRSDHITDRGRTETSHSHGTANRKILHSFKKQLEDDGNNRKLNSFIRDTTIKPKSGVNSTAFREGSLNTSKRHNSRVNFETSQAQEEVGPDQRLLGYDWIAALLDNDSDLVNQSESFFNELRDFRRANKDECSNQFYMAGPHTLVDFEPDPVVEALREPKVQPYIVNERLFTEPFKPGLIEHEDEYAHHDQSKKEPTTDNPRFVRVSIPRSTLQAPYRVKPHRRRSFDASDSCSLMDHCLLGWENTLPAMIPTAKALDLNTESGKNTLSQTTTLAEAEQVAINHNRSQWPFDRPVTRLQPLQSWRKHYMDTTLNMSVPAVAPASLSATRSSAGSESVKRATDKLLNSTYATMYEMERLKEERKLELNKLENL